MLLTVIMRCYEWYIPLGTENEPCARSSSSSSASAQSASSTPGSRKRKRFLLADRDPPSGDVSTPLARPGCCL